MFWQTGDKFICFRMTFDNPLRVTASTLLLFELQMNFSINHIIQNYNTVKYVFP